MHQEQPTAILDSVLIKSASNLLKNCLLLIVYMLFAVRIVRSFQVPWLDAHVLLPPF